MNSRKHVFLIMLVMSSGVLQAQTDIYEIISESEAVLQQLRDSADLKSMIDSAGLGDSDVQFKLGYMYRTGERPDGRTIQIAKEEIGILDYYSNSFKTDYKKAFYWLSKSAKNNNAEGENDLGIMYDYAQGIPESGDSAFYWYHRAALKCLPQAQNNVGRLYFFGKGTDQNNLKSYAWASVAFENGSKMAERGLNMLTEKLTEKELEEAVRIKNEIVEKINCEE